MNQSPPRKSCTANLHFIPEITTIYYVFLEYKLIILYFKAYKEFFLFFFLFCILLWNCVRFQIQSGSGLSASGMIFPGSRQKVRDPTVSGSTTLPKTMSENVLILLLKKVIT